MFIVTYNLYILHILLIMEVLYAIVYDKLHIFSYYFFLKSLFFDKTFF